MAEMKYVWEIMLHDPDTGSYRNQGYVQAGSMREALELAGHPNAVAIPQVNKSWPDQSDNQAT